jgi:hypothetical protein
MRIRRDFGYGALGIEINCTRGCGAIAVAAKKIFIASWQASGKLFEERTHINGDFMAKKKTAKKKIPTKKTVKKAAQKIAKKVAKKATPLKSKVMAKAKSIKKGLMAREAKVTRHAKKSSAAAKSATHTAMKKAA